MYSDNNLFNPSWTTGSLQSISPVVSVVSMIAVWVISLGGLFMVILPVLRFVINGVYVSAPRMCDWIDDAHKSGASSSSNSRVGAVLHVLLKIVPNFKALSDFDKGLVDPLSFFIKGIPLFCIYTFVGTFVHYGYFSKFGEKFSKLSLGIVDTVLDNTDPRAILDALPTFYAKPKFSGEKSSNPKNVAETTISKSLFSAITSTYTNIDKEGRVNLARNIEKQVTSIVGNNSNLSKWASDPTYKIKSEVRITKHEPNRITDVQRNDKEYTYYVYEYVNIRDLQLGIPDDVSSHVAEIMISATEGNKKVESYGSDTQVTLTIYYKNDGGGVWSPVSPNLSNFVKFSEGEANGSLSKYTIDTNGVIRRQGTDSASGEPAGLTFTSNTVKPITVMSKNNTFVNIKLDIRVDEGNNNAVAKIGNTIWSDGLTIVTPESTSSSGSQATNNGSSSTSTQSTNNSTTPAVNNNAPPGTEALLGGE